MLGRSGRSVARRPRGWSRLAAGFEAPFVLYAASISPERRAEAQRLGALDATNRPEELFRIVVGALNASTWRRRTDEAKTPAAYRSGP